VPELPEVETLVRGLGDLCGAVIERVEVHDLRLNLPANIIETTTIEAITRRGKYIVFHLSGERLLIFHLRMSGRLVRCCTGGEQKHVRLSLHLTSGVIHFVNPRRLGTVTYSGNGFPYPVGIEPLGEAFTESQFREIVLGTRAPIKPLLMNQKKIAGIGNIYALESLWRAMINPNRPSNTLSDREIANLHVAVQVVLQEAISHMGSTLGNGVSDYRSSEGAQGGFQERFAVYGREGKPCPRCGAFILRMKQAGRSTYFCPSCQQ
jgi:formamidopyrimidine-DNA glycosylase